jgi:DnaJ-class molecular chaperone
MGLFGGLLKLMLEHKAGPITLIEEIVSPVQSEYHNNSENDSQNSSSNYTPVNYASKKTCPECNGTKEDRDRYEPLFDIYAPCGTCHGEGEV